MNDRAQTRTTAGDLRILVVDDDRDLADTLSRLLTLEGYSVEPAYSIAAARAVLDRFPAEVALIDIRLGERSGLSLVQEFQHRRPEVSCIMMTAFASAETAIEALQEGAYDYLCKPFHTADLLATIQRCFERIALTRERDLAEADLRRRNRELEELNARLREAVSSMRALSAYLTLRELCGAVLEEIVGAMGAQSGVIALNEGRRLAVVHSLGPENVPAEETESLFREVLDSRDPGSTPASEPDANLPGANPITTFALTGAAQEQVGHIAVQAAGNRAFTQPDREIGEILVSFASEAIRLVQALESLTGSEERLRKIIDNSPSLISLTDLKGRFLVVNKRFEEWHGQRQHEVVGKTSRDIFPEDIARRYAAEFDAVADGGRGLDQEIELPFADGTRHALLVTKFPVLGADGKPMGIGMIGTDVTEYRRAQEQLRQAQKMEALGQLTGGIAHDFNNLLAVISGNMDLVQDELDGNPDLGELVEDALSAAHSGAELTHRLLAFGRRQTLDPQVTDAGRLVTGMSRLLARTLGEVVEIKRVLEDRLWSIEADRNQLETSLLNLAINARDAMPDGGTLTITTANVTLDRHAARAQEAVVPGQYVLLSVTDSGTGMSPEIAERAIQPFFTTKAVGEGSGLGLSMVYGFVKQSGGHMEISSTAGQGTTVRLYLPRSEKPVLDGEAPARDSLAGASAGERILVVEDEPGVRRMAGRMLTRLGYDVIEAGDADSALAVLGDRSDVDLLFTDVVLPGRMSGIELAREARARYPALKVLFTSGYTENPVPRDDPRADGIKLVKKPFVKQSLASMVRHALGRDGGAERVRGS